MLRIPNISEGRLNLADLKYATLSERELTDLALVAGDILMIRSNGSPKLVGRSVLVSSAVEGMAYAGYLMRLRVDPEVITPWFLELALASPDVRQQVEMPLRSTSGVNNINTGEVRSLRIVVPPLEEQEEIVQRAQHLMQAMDQIATRAEAASNLLNQSSRSVLAKAFRGDLLAAGL